MNISSSTELRIVAICSLVLYIKYYTALIFQGKVKFKSAGRAPEDMAFGQRNPQQTVFLPETSPEKIQAAKDAEFRWNRIVGNDLENVPFGVIFAWTSLIAGGNGTATSIAFVLFTVCRIVHTVAFANAIFLPRTIAYQIGVLCSFTLAINTVVGTFL